ncbi:MAG: 3-ketoacyl-ACP reductase [Betaproteobacteria bacterium]|nr:MAG: 3-ketoacyl-ACP reductase [Betaproteobacteria bacterium]
MTARVPVALVTGGARGIGRGIGRALAAAGFDVAIASLEPPGEAREALDDVGAAGRRALYLQHDVADVAAHAALVDRVCESLGAIDCLVNNAGVSSLRRGDMLELSADSFDRTLGVNLRGTFFLTQAVARAMIARRAADGVYRSVVTIGSANAEIVGVARADYCVSKAALSMMSKLFAARLAAEAIHVFELRPGIVRTDMTAPVRDVYDRYIENGGVPLGRWGTPDDVGATVATVARGLLPFATGEVLNVGGGLHLHRV